MKTIFLILYFWHADAGIKRNPTTDSLAMLGGASLQIHAMPSMAACELVGSTAKALADKGAPAGDLPAIPRLSLPLSYRCVESK
jgi:hypothetical protein